MIENSKLTAILNSLRKRTLENTLNWEDTADENTFLLSLENGSIAISSFETKDFLKNPDMTLEFRDDSGRIIDSVTLNPSYVSNYDMETMKMAYEIYNAVRNQVLKPNFTIDNILRELETDKALA